MTDPDIMLAWLDGRIASTQTKKVKYRKCSIEECDGNSHWTAYGASGFCNAHYKRNKRHGDPRAGGVSPGTIASWIEDLLAENPSHCVLWPFSIGRNGYGTYAADGIYGAHRYICTKANGEPPHPSYQAAHDCGNGVSGCVTPKHLAWKTVAQNANDKIAHGTMLQGESHPNSKLTADQAMAIFLSVGKLKDIAAKFQVNESTVSEIRNKKSWRHLHEGAAA